MQRQRRMSPFDWFDCSLHGPAFSFSLFYLIADHRNKRCNIIPRGSFTPLKIKNERSEEHTSELQSLMRISYAVFCLKKKKNTKIRPHTTLMKHTLIKSP